LTPTDVPKADTLKTHTKQEVKNIRKANEHRARNAEN